MAKALLSVWDKTGIVDVGRRLEAAGLEIVATGGTAKALAEAGVTVQDVSDVTGFPEMLDGRVKTLHPTIHGGLLARRDIPEHLEMIASHGIDRIDVLVSNLYPFSGAVASDSIDDQAAIELIDIGGPAMLRSAAKNHAGVIVLVDPDDYGPVLNQIEAGGVESVDFATRRRLAARAFDHVSAYDSLIASYLREPNVFPDEFAIGAKLLSQPRYGENPHQRAGVYAVPSPGPVRGIATWSVADDKEMSYNNYLDASAAWGCVSQFDEPACAIVKHTLPCGVGLADDLADAFQRALRGDPISAFGGIMATNLPVDLATVEAIGRHRLDVMIAPGYDDDALERLRRKRNLRIVTVGNPEPPTGFEFRSLPGGMLVQESDPGGDERASWSVVTKRQPSPEEIEALSFAWRVVPWVKSNAIVLAVNGEVTGVGAGQPNRVESVRIAAKVAGERAAGSVLASDAFFPFPDGIEAAAAAGVTAIAQPGGSVRDDECTAAADEAGLAMVFTGYRHFRH